MNNRVKVIGLMSGTSLDGLDISCCSFAPGVDGWTYKVIQCETLRYPKKIATQLAGAMAMSAEKLLAFDALYGRFLGEAVLDFVTRNRIKADFVASHGHTVFHQPANGFTLQIGDGNAIHAVTGIPVVYDFRSLDVALNGQGAPLVPIGDELLFSEYDYCLNLGGIANVSMKQKKTRIAFDVCFANMALNYVINQKGKQYDNRGETAASGSVDRKLLNHVKRFYNSIRAKRPSLGKELFDVRFKPLIDDSSLPIEDKLATLVESAAQEIAGSLNTNATNNSLLCTGGGAYNSFLVSRILEHCNDRVSIVLPEDDIIKFKEALIFAFLGLLRVNGKINCLKSVTGASRDSSSGVMVGFKN
jgi:anhydro-N-acetylmuramic acid kinase